MFCVYVCRVPGVTIATDVICGFPTETVDDFEQTVELVREYQFPSLFINQFYPRPGTPAARMTRIPTQEVQPHSTQSKIPASYRDTEMLCWSGLYAVYHWMR